MSNFTARIEQNARFFARLKDLHAFDAQVSRLLAQATMLASYAARDLYLLTLILIRDGFPVHVYLLASRFMQWLLTHVRTITTYKSIVTLATTLSGTLFVQSSLYK